MGQGQVNDLRPFGFDHSLMASHKDNPNLIPQNGGF